MDGNKKVQELPDSDNQRMKKTSLIIICILLGIAIVFGGVWFYFYVPDVPVEVLNKKYDVKPSDYIEIDGLNVHYKIEGLATDSIPIVLLHGTGSSLYTWNGWTKLLQDNHKIIRLDLPGFGLTGPHPTGDYRLQTYLAFIQSFLSELGIKKCILVGNSLGGEIAWRYALNFPNQVEKLILIGAAGYPTEVEYVPPISYMLLRLPVIRELVKKITPPKVIRGSLEFLYGQPELVTKELVELYFDMTIREGNREALTERMESIARPAPYQQIPFIETPTLILWGEKDQLIPVENAERFQRDLPNSTLVTFPEAGHMPMEEIPEKSVSAVKQFLSTPPQKLPSHSSSFS